MKLRISDNSIRFRLSGEEVRQLASGSPLEGRAELRPQPLVYRLEPVDRPVAGASSGPIEIDFSGGRLCARVPRALAQRWGAADEISIRTPLGPGPGGGAAVDVLIEKDLHG